jgi:HD superfamily phosphohydrolase
MHLMEEAIAVLRSKGQKITEKEAEAVLIAILLHDIGHGPYSHALEKSIIPDVSHEILSHRFMEEINRQMNGKLDLAIEIFSNRYQKKFLYQLVSSQLDMDRLDYLRRDSFFTGVNEGTIGSDRIIKMLTVTNDELVIEEKGIYSIEKFLVARRLMYWQVYLHKTVLAAENLLVKTLQRVKELSANNIEVFTTPSLSFFLYPKTEIKPLINNKDPEARKILLDHFADLDDSDIMASAKVWTTHSDKALAMLSKNLVTRKLYHIEVQNEPFSKEFTDRISEKTINHFNIEPEVKDYFVFCGEISNNTYQTGDDQIKILLKSGKIVDITEASDMFDQQVVSRTVTKHFLCYPKNIML